MDAINDLVSSSFNAENLQDSLATCSYCTAKCIGIKVSASHTHISRGTSNDKGE